MAPSEPPAEDREQPAGPEVSEPAARGDGEPAGEVPRLCLATRAAHRRQRAFAAVIVVVLALALGGYALTRPTHAVNRATSVALASHTSRHPALRHRLRRPRAPTPSPLKLGVSETTPPATQSAPSSPLTPPSYLMPYFHRLAARAGVPWQVLAALVYTEQGGYAHVLAGAAAPAVTAASRQALSEGRRAANVNVIAHATTGAAQPSQALIHGVRALRATSGAAGPGQALASYTGSSARANTVLTRAQQLEESDVTSSSSPRRKLAVMRREARLLNGLPYVWGGGHEIPAWVVNGGYDCSGFVSEVLHAAGYLDSPETTQTLPGVGDIVKGPGKLVTIYDRTINTTRWTKKKLRAAGRASGALSARQQTAGVHLVRGRRALTVRLSGAQIRAIEQAADQKGNEQDNSINDEHVIINLDGQWWESGGDTPDGGAERVHRIVQINPSYVNSFNLVLHPAGM